MDADARSSPGLRLGLVALGIALALGGGELALRLAGPERDAGTLRSLHEPRPDRPWLYGLRPGARVRVDATGDVLYTINADGFRDRPREKVPPRGTWRAVVLGDSVAFGYGVEQEATFPARLERLLSRAGAPAEVLNLAVNGYNPYNEARLFEDVGGAYAPRLVLVQFCVNDLNDPSLHFDAQTRLGLGEIPDEAYPDPAARRPLPGWPARICLASRLCSRLLAPGARSERDVLALLAPPARLGPREREWLRARYDEIAQAASAAGARFAVVAFPHRAQLEATAGDGLERDLAALGEEAGWPVLDLLPGFRAGAARGVPLFLDAWHPGAEGHRLAAELVAAQLEELGLAPPGSGPQGGAPASDPPASIRSTAPRS